MKKRLSRINEATLDSPIGPTSVNSPFGPRWGTIHYGVDLRAESGTEIRTPLDGEVIDAKTKINACGGTIFIKHADGYKTRYCHCKQINVSKGDVVKKGDVIGLTGGGASDVGNGRSTGPHLHFEVYKDGKVVNPMDHLGPEVKDYVYGKSKQYTTKKITATPDMINKMIEMLKTKNIKDEDISPYTKKSKIEISTDFTVKDGSKLVNKFKEIAGDDYEKFISDVKSMGLDPNIAIRQLHVESIGFSPDVIICKRKSPKGAMGLAQFMPRTWDRYGEGSPCNVSDSLKAYVKFMGVLLKRFPNRPDLAVAAYNSGPNWDAYKKAYNNDLDLTSIKSQIPSETYNYYKKIFQV